MKDLFNRAALGFFRLIPMRLAQHLLFLLRSHPEISDGWGYHIRPIHYYEPLPDFQTITKEQLQHRREFPAIDFNWPEQLKLVAELGTRFGEELDELARCKTSEGFDFENAYFAGFDAAVYYSLIKYLKPTRIIEIGSGYSTQIAAKALTRNRQQGQPGKLTCIEPYPQPRLTEAHLDIQLIEKGVEEMDFEFFSSLKSGDILFIDSSHALKLGSDVYHEFLEILPRLKQGVWIHIHDIFFPQDYPAEWVIQKRLAFNEQYLLQAFLSFNRDFSIALSNYWLCLEHTTIIKKLWPQTEKFYHARPHGCGSFWIYQL